MKRRGFIVSVGGMLAIAARPSAAQRGPLPVVAFVNGGTAQGSSALASAFLKGLAEAGYVDGRNVHVELHWTEFAGDRPAAVATEIVRRQVSAIAVGGGRRLRLAVKAATSTIPVVFTSGTDPVNEGLVANLARPGGNITGVVVPTTALDVKRIEILNEFLPPGDTIAVLANPNGSGTETQLRAVEQATRRLGRQLAIVLASTAPEIDNAFADLALRRSGALLVSADAFLNGRQEQLVALTLRYRTPAIFEWREFADAGGLMSYGSDIRNGYRETGVYVGRILKGARPAELPVLQADKYEFVVNLKTAAALGVTVPQTLLLRANEVIH